MKKRAGYILLLLFLTQTAFAEIEEKVQVGIMEVWVKVTDKQGHPISDLQPTDFQIYVDGQNMDLRCFNKTFYDATASIDEAPPGRKFVFFFDLLNTLPGDMDFLKNGITRFLLNSFQDNDEGMVFALLPSYHLGVVQKMTSNKQALIATVRRMRGNMSLGTTLESNEKQLMNMLYQFDTTADSNPQAERGVGQRPMDTLHTAQSLVRNFAAQEENRSRFTLDAFTTIAEYLGGFPMEGPVALLYVSGGFPTNPGEQYYEMLNRVLEERFATNEGSFSVMEHPRYDMQDEIRTTVGGLNRMNVTIYSLDAKGLLLNAVGAERDSLQATRGMHMLARNQQLQDSLVLVARETGGIAFTNSQNFTNGLADIARDMNEQYLLCASLPSSTKRGAYHKIEVKVSRPNVNVRHRKGYID
jgi:VWFA-related protein